MVLCPLVFFLLSVLVGNVNDVTVRQPARQADLLAVDISLGIPSSDDHSLTIFERLGAAGHPLLAADSNGYHEVSGAQGSLKHAIAPTATGSSSQ